MKTLLVYWSKNGSNRFMADKLSEDQGCDIEKLEPRVEGAVIPATATRISMGNRRLKKNIEDYQNLIVCGPLYMGRMAAPCSDFIRKYGKRFDRISCVTCCGSTDEKKDDTFGYGRVFSALKKRLGASCGFFGAMPIDLILSDEQRGDDQAMMNARLNSDSWNDAAETRLRSMVENLR